MIPSEWDSQAREAIQVGSPLVERHLKMMAKMVRIDSRSFGVNEFEGDRIAPSDMQEILELAADYLKDVGFDFIKINRPPPGPERAPPILMAEILSAPDQPTLLMYAHLDKQPYMDDGRFAKWDGVPPTELRWNEDRSRAYGRGAADDLSGVIAIGMAIDALLKTGPGGPKDAEHAPEPRLPCNVKVIFETEEESGSHSLIKQILQNKEFFITSDAVIITDVVNPDTGVPGLTTSLRGIIQMEGFMRKVHGENKIDEQTALYKVIASLVREDQSLAVTAIANADHPVTEEERRGYELIPTSLKALRSSAGLLPETSLTVPSNKVAVIESQLRKSYANARPGHRVTGGVVLGTAGARLTFRVHQPVDRNGWVDFLETALQKLNTFHLKLIMDSTHQTDWVSLDVVLQSSVKDPHSGVTGGPFPVPEIQLARMIDQMIGLDGKISFPGLEKYFAPGGGISEVTVQALHTEPDGTRRLFSDPIAKSLIEIRLAPGNDEMVAAQHLKTHLFQNVPPGFSLELKEDKGGSPWSTGIDHPAFPLMLKSLEVGYEHTSCLYGCGGSIPFVAKLMTALGNVPPLCIGPYDQDCRMHEPGESLSMPDLLGCARAIAHFMIHCPNAFSKDQASSA